MAIEDSNKQKGSTTTKYEDPNDPFYLHHSDQSGAILVTQSLNDENYSTWSRAMTMALNAKNKEGFINLTIKEPATASTIEFQQWTCCNNLVKSLLLNSISKDIGASVMYNNVAFDAIESENQRTSQLRTLIDQISLQKGQIVSLDAIVEEKQRLEQECGQLKVLVQELERKGLGRLIVIMACNRADYLERTVKSVLKYQSSVASKFPLFVSQDGSHPSVKQKALSYDQLTYMQHLDYEPVHAERPGELIAYYKIARHYKWALDGLFYKHNFNRVIILEDDMEIAPHFFDYFEAAAALLDEDRSIMAVSSWNDNGQKQFVHDPKILYRSDFFPGLGWTLTRSTWDELSPKWPKAYWDDWLRLKENHKGRQFIRPEVCRTYNFGEHGSSLGQFFKQYLEPIKLNDVLVDWKSMDLSYLMEDKYIKHFVDIVQKAKPILGSDLVLKARNIGGDVRVQYTDQPDFEYIARQFGIFEEWKDGVPRTAYKGIVVFRYHISHIVYSLLVQILSSSSELMILDAKLRIYKEKTLFPKFKILRSMLLKHKCNSYQNR